MSLTLTLDFQYKTTIEKLWAALTDSKKLAKWTLENDFKPIVGHQFTFRAQPTEFWDGIIQGEVLIVEEPTRLSYTWAGGEKHTVTWTLQDLGGGQVNLHLEQSGISNERALGGAKYGWTNWNGELEKLLAE
ncbi:SRPBCC domain-containing protein [Cohnella sp. AR92]|uniref:SRPBCC family protein n=1 Tax=Cohnella sp. AR92 TaxID=648716 RepID=UPI000F8D0341|nr:SRPBCC domain-containing protein [Cohnella sp. AR92]RUS46939.1 SRPBCC domain-containing protein [Cohnella sp. AR92]